MAGREERQRGAGIQRRLDGGAWLKGIALVLTSIALTLTAVASLNRRRQ
jgi:hypothetical protein